MHNSATSCRAATEPAARVQRLVAGAALLRRGRPRGRGGGQPHLPVHRCGQLLGSASCAHQALATQPTRPGGLPLATRQIATWPPHLPPPRGPSPPACRSPACLPLTRRPGLGQLLPVRDRHRDRHGHLHRLHRGAAGHRALARGPGQELGVRVRLRRVRRGAGPGRGWAAVVRVRAVQSVLAQV
jgi:hypothetical protein